MNKDYELMRAEIWRDLYVAHVRSTNKLVSPSYVLDYADEALKAFDERFKDRLSN